MTQMSFTPKSYVLMMRALEVYVLTLDKDDPDYGRVNRLYDNIKGILESNEE